MGSSDGPSGDSFGPALRPFTPGPDTSREFRAALGRFATGVTVVTTQTADGPLGITANSFAAVSLDPPLVLWSPARAAGRFAPFVTAEHFAIHIMSADQRSVCEAFVSDGAAFGDLVWAPGKTGAPLIEGCLAQFECVRHAVHDGGDHAIIVGRVLHAAHGDGAPLLFAGGRYGAMATVG
ncbi:flavin reductase family protein [Oceaniovalibus sp. ACAM 378]|jgi:flavin reductase (DIM6/NTAB) family NADH-FMN oxidoreductase RutF|uniref:flavin reductase family protein n=1 Tax=Oceaniovalibus sp. ACAM 378 TaxID=2599923 RepID=UPI0011DB7F18|nr:flavin reductase family protein [Oceaniovalibus sp. ACAM 378]TYB91073.1 flavin reductase family protein [Oceaniovalibus sp. ACAM 378]